jgi:hypothetical protein
MIIAFLINVLVVVDVCCVFFFRHHKLTIFVSLVIVVSSFTMVVAVALLFHSDMMIWRRLGGKQATRFQDVVLGTSIVVGGVTCQR